MKNSILRSVLAVSLGVTSVGLANCGPGQEAEEATATALNQEEPADDKTYAATGSITAIAGNQVTIAHSAVEDLDWPAQTADFQAQNLDQIIDLRPGDQVSFTFTQAGGQYMLVSVQKRGE